MKTARSQTSRRLATGDWRLTDRLLALFVRARAAKKILNGVVPFVAGHLVDLGIGRLERPFRRPRRGPGVGVVNGHAVCESVGVDFRESFDDMHPFAGIHVVGLGPEVRGIDHERGSLPMADRIAEPLLD